MAKLQFTLEGNSLGEFELSKERITIGRRPTNDIHIDNLAVSGDHAVVTTIGNDSFLEDLNSTNGTLVNSKPVKKHVLHHNDVIEFGKYQLVYINNTQTKTSAANAGFENTVVMRPTNLKVVTTEKPEPDVQQATTEVLAQVEPQADAVVVSEAVAESSTTSTVEKNAPKIGRLQMLNGANSGREIQLTKALTTLGKPGSQVAVITKRANGYFITHVEGENVPFINGQKIGLQAVALNDHDVIDIAGAKMEFFLA
jgi:pSer/pThr/pTyr-binding forkhead associated (FHA) protein